MIKHIRVRLVNTVGPFTSCWHSCLHGTARIHICLTRCCVVQVLPYCLCLSLMVIFSCRINRSCEDFLLFSHNLSAFLCARRRLSFSGTSHLKVLRQTCTAWAARCSTCILIPRTVPTPQHYSRTRRRSPFRLTRIRISVSCCKRCWSGTPTRDRLPMKWSSIVLWHKRCSR